jgi:tripartite-type tricarboxylate transporter receptor subunit TctC
VFVTRRLFLAGALAAPFLPRFAGAQTAYPTRPIKLYQGFPPGGNVDAIARVVGGELARMGQPVVVESKPGAGGAIASDMVAKAPPDGYSLVLMSASHATGAALAKSLPYAPVDGFAMVSTVVTYPFIVLVRSDSPFQSLADLLAAARAKPESLAFGSTGIGSIYQLATESMARQAGVKFLHVPYKGEAPFIVALLAGEIPFTFATPTLALPNIKAGKVRALATTGAERWRLLPDVPTVAESGVRFEAESWMGLATTAGTPAPIVARLNDEVKRALQSAEVRARLDQLGVDPVYSTPDAMRRRIAADVQRWKQVVKDVGIEPQ